MRKIILFAALAVGLGSVGVTTGCDSGGTGGAAGSGGSAGGGSGGSTGGTGGTAGSGGNTGGGGSAPAPTCADYCGDIQANCTGNNAQYSSEAICLATCAAFPLGTSADTMGNTLGCRIYHAGAAASDAATHCTHAGPGGDGLCGNNCDGFCAVVQTVCTGANEQYAMLADCLSECSGYPTMPKYNANVATGDSFACRMYHATVASTDAAGHCEHVDDGMMGDPCFM